MRRFHEHDFFILLVGADSHLVIEQVRPTARISYDLSSLGCLAT
jgi:hypothetical protein